MVNNKKKNNGPMVFEGLKPDGNWIMENSSKLIAKKTRERANDLDAVKEYLNDIADGSRDSKGMIYMRIPYADSEGYAIVGPTFAALLLRDYDLVKRILSQEKKMNRDGFLVAYKLMETSQIYLDQLFLADMNIPADLLKALHDRLMKQKGYFPMYDICSNDLLYVYDNRFSKGDEFGFDLRMGNAPFGNRFERLRKKCPEMLYEMIDTMAGDTTCCNVITNSYNCNDAAALCRVVYRYSGSKHRAVLDYFESETRIILEVFGNPFSDPMPDIYAKDARIVYRLIKDDPPILKEYARVLLYVTTVIDNRTINSLAKRMLNDRPNHEWTVDDIRLFFYGKTDTDPVFSNYRWQLNGQLFAADNSANGEDYVEYLAKLMANFKFFTGRKINVNGDSELMYEYGKAIEEVDFRLENTFSINSPFGPVSGNTEDNVRRFRKSMKQFISRIDSYVYKEPRTRYESLIIKLADEELMAWHFEKGMLKCEKIPEYMEMAIKSKRVSLLPCLTGYQA